MTKEEFDKCNNLDELLELKLSERKWRLFAVACCRSIQHLMTDERSIKAVEAAELFTDNLITEQELKTARCVVGEKWEPAKRAAHYITMRYAAWSAVWYARRAVNCAEDKNLVCFFKDIINPYANPINSAILNWKDQTVVKIAEKAYNDKDFSVIPILADALEEAGCQDPEILNHCRNDQQHMKGCWVVDLILGKG